MVVPPQLLHGQVPIAPFVLAPAPVPGPPVQGLPTTTFPVSITSNALTVVLATANQVSVNAQQDTLVQLASALFAQMIAMDMEFVKLKNN